MQTNINIVTDAKRIILYRYITIEVHHPNACLNSSRRSSTNSSNRRLSRRTSASSSSLGTSLIEWSSSSRRDARLATDEAYASMNSVTNCLARGGASSRLPDARNPASGRIPLPLSRSLPIRGPASSLPSLPAAVGPWRLVTDVGSPPSGFTTPSPRSRASSCVGTDTPASSSGPCVAIPGEHVLRHASFKKKTPRHGNSRWTHQRKRRSDNRYVSIRSPQARHNRACASSSWRWWWSSWSWWSWAGRDTCGTTWLEPGPRLAWGKSLPQPDTFPVYAQPTTSSTRSTTSSLTTKAQSSNTPQIQHEMNAAFVQEFYQTVRDKCFKACITKPGTSLSSSEQQCLAKCCDRYQEATEIVTKSTLEMSGYGE